MKIRQAGVGVLALLVSLILYQSDLLQAQEGGVPSEGQDVTRFAVIGDFGSGNQDEQDVADLVESWDVDFIITTGDNY